MKTRSFTVVWKQTATIRRIAWLAVLSASVGWSTPACRADQASAKPKAQETTREPAAESQLRRAGVAFDPKSLVEAVQTAPPEVAHAAATVLVSRSVRDAVPLLLVAAASEKDRGRARLLARSLARLGESRGVALLEEMLVTERARNDALSRHERQSIATSLAELGVESGTRELRLLLEESDTLEDSLAAGARLARFSPDVVRKELAEYLGKDLEPGAGLRLAVLLAETGDPRGYPYLVRCLTSPNPDLRASAVWDLQKFLEFEPAATQPPIDVAPAIVRGLEDPELEVRRTSLLAVLPALRAGIARTPFVLPVRRLAESEPDRVVRGLASTVLGSLSGGRRPSTPEQPTEIEERKRRRYEAEGSKEAPTP